MMMFRAGPTGRWIQIGLSVLLAVTAFAALSAGQPISADDSDDWYVLEIDGQRAGWMHVKSTVEGDRVKVETEMRIRIARGEIEIPIQTATRFLVHRESGSAISMWSMQKYAALPVETEWTFGEDGIAVRSTQAGQVTESREPLPEGEWLTPVQAARAAMEAIKKGEQEQTLRLIDPSIGLKPVTVTRKIVAKEVEIDIPGRGKVKASKYSTTTDYIPGIVGEEFYAADGEMLRTVTPLGGLVMTMVVSDRETALARTKAPELMLNTFVKPDRVIPNPREARRVVLDLNMKVGPLPEIPSLGAQTFVRRDEGSGRLTITMEPRVAAPVAEVTNADYLGASATIDPTDEQLKSLVKEATESVGRNALERAEAMRRFVYGYIDKKALDVAFATSTEIAKNRTGDCSEHGVLLAAMLRADGIPARVVAGLLYVDEFLGAEGIFGYHMWAQALIDGKWVDFDATLPAARFDATHIVVAPASLKDGAMGVEMATLLPLMGSLEINVVSTDPEH